MSCLTLCLTIFYNVTLICCRIFYRKVKDKDPSLVGRSILVLTMCDKIVPETFKQDTLPTIDGDSRSTYASYFTDIVCVSNKIDGQKEPHEVSFLEFRRIFEETKRQELLVFQQRGNLSTTDRCTTEAVFRKIDSVFKLLLEQALQVGHENLQKLVGEKKSEMLRLLAPPPHLYQDNESGHGGRFLFSKQMLLQEISEKAKSFMASAIQGMQLFPDADPNFETKATYLQTKTGVEWPITFQRGDISSGLQRRAYFKKALEELKDYESDVLHKVDQMFMDPTEGVFAAKHSPFHRIHRFPNLQTRLRERFVSIGGNAGQLFHTKLDAYLNRIWENEEPTGQLTIERLVDIMENARHLFLIDCHEYLDEKLTGALIDLTEANLLAEADDFVQRRQLLNYEYERTSLQMRYLLECLTLQNDSERLMAQIQEAKRALSSFTEPTNEWEQVFWEESYLQYRRSLSAPPSVASSQQHYLQLSQQNHVSFAAAAVGSLLVTTLSHQRDHANNSDSSGSTSTSSAAATARTSSVSLFSPTKTFVKRSPDSTAKHATIASPNIVGTQMEEDEPNNETYENGEQGAPKTTLPDNFRTSRSPLGTEKPPRATPGLSDSETSDGESDGEGDHGKKRNREVDEGGSAKRSRVQQAEETQNSSWLPTSWFQSRSPPPTTTRASLPAPTRPHASLLRDDNGSQPKEESKSVSLHSPTYPTLKREREQVPLGLPAPPAPPATQTPLRDTDTNGMQQSSALGSTEGNQRRRYFSIMSLNIVFQEDICRFQYSYHSPILLLAGCHHLSGAHSLSCNKWSSHLNLRRGVRLPPRTNRLI